MVAVHLSGHLCVVVCVISMSFMYTFVLSCTNFHLGKSIVIVFSLLNGNVLFKIVLFVI